MSLKLSYAFDVKQATFETPTKNILAFQMKKLKLRE